jgi:hypothetical protein
LDGVAQAYKLADRPKTLFIYGFHRIGSQKPIMKAIKWILDKEGSKPEYSGTIVFANP